MDAAIGAAAGGHRQPLALLVVALVLGAWFWRLRVATAAASTHPLAGSMSGDLAGLESAEALIAGEESEQ